VKRDELYLRHILDASAQIAEYVSVGHDRFLIERHWQDAIIRQLEILGEASKHLSQELRDEHPNVPWRRIAGLRDVLAHNYMGVDLNAVWQAASESVPALRSSIQTILNELEA
jgi:uncharacterized protein with HEPN domain